LAAAGDLSKLTLADADALLASQGPQACWNRFWNGYQIQFVMSIAGAALVVVSLLTCFCFCCAEAPPRSYGGGQVRPGGALHVGCLGG